MEQALVGPPIDVESIVDAVRGPKKGTRAVRGLPSGQSAENLRYDLELTGDRFILARWLELNHTEKQRIEILTRIMKTSRKLASHLGELRGGPLKPANELGGPLRPDERGSLPLSLLYRATLDEANGPRGSEGAARRGADVLHRALNGVLLLERWSAAALEDPPDNVEGPDHDELALLQLKDGESAESWLIGKRLPELYTAYFGRPFGRSKPPTGGRPFGPGIRFVQSCLTQWGLSKSPTAIEAHWRNHRKRHGT